MSKWITGIRAEQLVSEVACTALGQRLELVSKWVDRVLRKPTKANSVHQLRVATRRATATLQLFSECLPAKRAMKLARAISGIRKAAGPARDCDVMEERFRNQSDEGRRVVLKKLEQQRKVATKRLVRQLERADKLQKQIDKVVNKVRWEGESPEPTFAEVGGQVFNGMVGEFFEKSGDDLSCIQSLHALRISGKRLRYGIEIVASAYDDSIRTELHSIFAEAQERMGAVNDLATNVHTLSELIRNVKGKKSKRYLREIVALEKARLRGAQCDFASWWTDLRVSDLYTRCERFTNSIAKKGRTFQGESRRQEFVTV